MSGLPDERPLDFRDGDFARLNPGKEGLDRLRGYRIAWSGQQVLPPVYRSIYGGLMIFRRACDGKEWGRAPSEISLVFLKQCH